MSIELHDFCVLPIVRSLIKPAFYYFGCLVRFKNCAHSNLNGLNTADTAENKKQIWWKGIFDEAGALAALDTAEMMIRPRTVNK